MSRYVSRSSSFASTHSFPTTRSNAASARSKLLCETRGGRMSFTMSVPVTEADAIRRTDHIEPHRVDWIARLARPRVGTLYHSEPFNHSKDAREENASVLRGRGRVVGA